MATLEQLTGRYKKLYHMAEGSSWESIRTHGLLSTSALLMLFEIKGEERERIECRWRRESIPITHAEHGTAMIRDQKPMPPDRLRPYLCGCTPSQWYKLLNGKVFFWVSKSRLNALLGARAYRERFHDVITFDSRLLVEHCNGSVKLCPFNSGSVLDRDPPMRCPASFRSIADYPWPPGDKPAVELTVECKLENVESLALSVDRYKGRELQENIWKR